MKYKYFVKFKGEDFTTRGYYENGEDYEEVTLISGRIYPVNDVREEEYVCNIDGLAIVPVTCRYFETDFEIQ